MTPDRTGGIRASDEVDERVAFGRLAVAAATARTPRAARTRRAMTKRVSEKPKIVIGEFLGLTKPQVLDWSTPNTNSPRPAAESTEPTTSSFGLGVRARGRP